MPGYCPPFVTRSVSPGVSFGSGRDPRSTVAVEARQERMMKPRRTRMQRVHRSARPVTQATPDKTAIAERGPIWRPMQWWPPRRHYRTHWAMLLSKSTAFPRRCSLLRPHRSISRRFRPTELQPRHAKNHQRHAGQFHAGCKRSSGSAGAILN